MKAMAIHGFGTSSQFEMIDIPKPTPGSSKIPLADLLILETFKSSSTIIAWFLLIAVDDLWRKSRLIFAILLCSLCSKISKMCFYKRNARLYERSI